MPSILYANVHQNFDGSGSLTAFVFGTPGEQIEITSIGGYSQTAEIGPDGAISIDLPQMIAMSGTGTNEQGLKIASDGDVSAYISNRETATTDLTVVFEESSLGNGYVLASFGDGFQPFDGGQFSVQATEGDTTFSFLLPDGQNGSVTLSEGETFKFSTSDATGNAAIGVTVPAQFDLTGTIISADAPIAVFSGHSIANIGDGAADHIVEQMPATSSLSLSYVVAEIKSASGTGNNLVRVVAAEDETEVRIDGVVVSTLAQGEFHEFVLSVPAQSVDVSKPALVAQYLQGASTAGEGDPAMSFVPGRDTWLSSYIAATPSGTEALAQNLVNVIVPTSAVSSVQINGADVDDSAFAEVMGTDLSVANIPVTPGVVRVEASENFQLSLFGFDSFDSFLTFGGASFASGLSNVPPQPADDAFSVDEGASISGSLLADNGNGIDRDRDDDPLTVIAINGVETNLGVAITLDSGAQLLVNASGDFTYTASLDRDLGNGEIEPDTFTYTVSDGRSTGEATATVSVAGQEEISFEVILPDALGPGQEGQAQVSYTGPADSSADTAGETLLFAVSTEGGLVADPFSGAFAETAFVLADTTAEGAFEAIGISVKGSAGPRSSLGATVQLADLEAPTEIADRLTALQPSFVEADVAARIEANLTAQFGETIGSLTSSLGNFSGRFSSLGLNTDSATAALAFAIEAAGDFGSLQERGKDGSLGQGWSTLADLGLDIDGTTIQMRGLTDLGALRAMSVDASALYAVSNSAGRSVSVSGDTLALSAPIRPRFEQGIDGSFQTTNAFAGSLTKTGEGFSLRTDDGETLFFDPDGAFLRMEMADGLSIAAEHDSEMRVVGLSGPNGASLTFARDAEGALQSVEDADGGSASFVYDAGGRLETVTRPEGQSSFTYDEHGDLVTATAPGGIVAQFTYDSLGRLVGADYGSGAQTESFAYDDAGGLTITDGAGRTIAIDLLPGSVVGRITDGAGSTSEILYDESGAISGVRAPDGTETLFEFDELGRLSQITDANGAVLGFTYGETGEDPTSFTDAGGATRSFDYDSGGRITQATWPDGTSLEFTYDDQGNLTGYSNRRGDDVTYSYDARGRLLSESDGSAGPTTYTYDARGRLTSAINDQGTTSLAYDSADRVTQIDYPTGKSLFYAYNDAGLRASMSDGGDYNVFYQYDALGRLTGLRDEDSQMVSYEYDGAGNLVREENGNGTVSLFTYDAAGRLTRIENQAPDASINSFNAYTYDAAGQRITNETQDGTWTYGYDAIGQLTSANFASTNAEIADKSLTYEYDTAGNRTRVVEDGVETLYTANALNQYTQVGDATFTYDADGNMTSRTDPSGTTTYSYDLDNRLTSVVQSDGTVFEFEYDLFGNRVAKTVDGTETEYLVDPFGLGDVVSEFTDGALSSTYAHGLGLAAGEIDGVGAFYDADAVGTVTTLTGTGGTVQNSYVFTPFGTEMLEVEGLANAFEFNGSLGVIEDSEDISYMRARSYSDELGRFLSEDPLWVQGDAANLQRFSSNEPVSLADPSGEIAWFAVIPLAAGYYFFGIPNLEEKYENYQSTKEERERSPFPDLLDAKVAEAESDLLIEGLLFGAPTPKIPFVGNILDKAINGAIKPVAKKVLDFTNAPEFWDDLFRNDTGPNGDPDGDGIPNSFDSDDDGDGIDDVFDGAPFDPNPPELDPDSPFSPPTETESPETPDTPDGTFGPEREDGTRTGASDGDGRSDGDPHLVTFDGTGYSFQAVGEFTLAKGDGFEIQTRQTAINDNVSVNAATVMNIGDDVVGIYAEEDIPLVINGTAVVLEQGESVAVGDGSVYRGNFGRGDTLGVFDVYVVTDGNGNGFWTNVYFGANHLRPFVSTDNVAGLLGNLNNDRADDFQLRDGSVLPQPLAQTVLYGEFADSWRITQEDSLFVYAEGESTETFTDRNFPTNIVTLGDLDPEVRAAAEAVAIENGLTPGTFEFETTVLDVALTGSEDFAIGVGGAPEFQPEDEVVEIVEVEINEAPVAGEDTAEVDEDGSVLIAVLDNDSDPEGDALVLLGGEDPNGGTVEVVDDQLRFTPAPNFNGPTTLSYRLGDSGGNTVIGAVALNVAPQPDAPVGDLIITGTTRNGEALRIDVSGISDADGLGPIRFAWLRDGIVIEGEDAVGYLLTEDDIGARLSASISYVDGGGTEETVTSAPTEVVSGAGLVLTGTPGNDTLIGGANDDEIDALGGNDVIRGGEGDDILNAGDGTDLINGGPGNDIILGGATEADRRDTILGGDGDDEIDAGYGNDLVYGQDGDDIIAGGFGADELFGQNGNDVITGSAFSDLIFGGAGDDFVNGGFGFDRVNGGVGADRFFHAGVEGHASDFIQDFSHDEGDTLVFGGPSATAEDFFVATTHLERDGVRSGDGSIEEAFVVHRPTSQILWALIDGADQSSIIVNSAGTSFDILS